MCRGCSHLFCHCGRPELSPSLIRPMHSPVFSELPLQPRGGAVHPLPSVEPMQISRPSGPSDPSLWARRQLRNVHQNMPPVQKAEDTAVLPVAPPPSPRRASDSSILHSQSVGDLSADALSGGIGGMSAGNISETTAATPGPVVEALRRG